MSDRSHSSPGDRSLPDTTKIGLVVMAFGLVFDLVEHGFVEHAGEPVVAGFPIAEHAAHMIVLIGMVLVLGGIVADGIHGSRRNSESRHRPSPAKRRQSHALR
jgi:hypothetical protein